MVLVNDDWRGEHLIRAPKRTPVPEVSPKTRDALMERKLKELGMIQRAIEKGLSRPCEINLDTGLSSSRIYDICRQFNVKLEKKHGVKA